MPEESAADRHAHDSDAEYPVTPSTEPPPRSPFPEPAPQAADDEPLDRADLQFSIRDMLVLVAAAAVFMSVLGLLPDGYTAENFAGLSGTVVLVWMVIGTLVEPTWPMFRMGFWAMLAIYLLSCVVAASKPMWGN